MPSPASSSPSVLPASAPLVAPPPRPPRPSTVTPLFAAMDTVAPAAVSANACSSTCDHPRFLPAFLGVSSDSGEGAAVPAGNAGDPGGERADAIEYTNTREINTRIGAGGRNNRGRGGGEEQSRQGRGGGTIEAGAGQRTKMLRTVDENTQSSNTARGLGACSAQHRQPREFVELAGSHCN
ncbi:hypothetical protein I4F81_000622 [Pyropia yezoensis]|uniref:Uncharacterized protein n=1 Tax=Pyropia yezoensis TaxID=2788 RepID=A0ACC3BJB4_PYRYE|nr:hypothetical protein I4F81_000622 [Neopyropia yezoensis]